ncbi:MAG: type I restriction-modification enzyme R subunit C-terminal domain-containing protein [Pontibacterium sp.]
MYWSAEGKPISGKELVDRMFGELPQFFKNEEQLREIWGNPDTREERVQAAKPLINQAFADYKQQEFIDFVLRQYVTDGVNELSPKKMHSLIELKYSSISDAAAEFGSPALIRDTFVGFQRYLYAR